jgi:hypothetical protein
VSSGSPFKPMVLESTDPLAPRWAPIVVNSTINSHQ